RPGARGGDRNRRHRGEAASANLAGRRLAGTGHGVLPLALAALTRAGQLAGVSLPGLLHRRGLAWTDGRARRAPRAILASGRGPDGGAGDVRRLRARVPAARLAFGVARSGGAHSRRRLWPDRRGGRRPAPADRREGHRHGELCPDGVARLLHAVASARGAADRARSMAPGAGARLYGGGPALISAR